MDVGSFLTISPTPSDPTKTFRKKRNPSTNSRGISLHLVPELRRNSGTESKQGSRHDESATVRYLDKQELLSSSETALSSEGERLQAY
jgi:hypothetical protein